MRPPQPDRRQAELEGLLAFGSKCSGPITTASSGQSERGTSSAGNVATSLRTGPGSVAGKPISTLTAERWRIPARQARAVSARSTVSRTLPRIPTPGASPLPIGGSPFDGRYSGDGLSSTHGMPSSSAANPPHAVITSETTRSGSRSRSTGTLSTAIRAARWWILAPASVSSSNSVGSSPTSSTAFTPTDRPVSSHSVPVSSVGESPAAKNFNAEQARETHGQGPVRRPRRHACGYPATRPVTSLKTMTETTSAVDATANARVVETFLYALQDMDFDTAESTLADNILYQNVGYTTMRGSRRIMNLFRRGNGRGGFEVKFSRVAAEGNVVLNERTDAIIIGPVRLQFWVCGVFEVHGGKITLWKDYIDLLELVKGTVRGLVGAVVPSLRPTF